MSREISTETLFSLVPSRMLDVDAIKRGIGLIPTHLRGEYLGKLRDPDQQVGTLHELRVIGKLVGRSLRGSEVIPTPKGHRYDCILRVAGVDMELEISAHIRPAYDQALDRVCERVGSHLSRKHPGRAYTVAIGNLGSPLPERSDSNGVVRLDEDETFREVIVELDNNIDGSGNIGPGWDKEHVFNRVVRLAASTCMSVSQGPFRKPWGTDIGQVKRNVMKKITRPQWTGGRPALLAVVLAHDPDPDLLCNPADNICEEAFGRIPYLAAIIALPYRAVNQFRRVFFSERLSGHGVLRPEQREALCHAFRFYYGVDYRWALTFRRYIRTAMQRNGEWPGWRKMKLE